MKRHDDASSSGSSSEKRRARLQIAAKLTDDNHLAGIQFGLLECEQCPLLRIAFTRDEGLFFVISPSVERREQSKGASNGPGTERGVVVGIPLGGVLGERSIWGSRATGVVGENGLASKSHAGRPNHYSYITTQ